MRIAVLGGGLLGCATTADIALVQEIDVRKGRSEDGHTVTLFCSEGELGGEDFRSLRIDGTVVEIGRYRTLPHITGTYLSDLLSLANGENGFVNVLGRMVRIPGDSRTRRGTRGAATLLKPFEVGSYGRLIRSSAPWDFAIDSYGAVHKGWPLLDVLHRILNNEMWRALAVAGLMWSFRRCLEQQTFAKRGAALVIVVIMLGIVVFGPSRVVGSWQRIYSFWGSTLPMLIMHGLTAGISRGSVIGFVNALKENNARNRATCAPSLGVLLQRTGLHMYLRGSGADFTEKFKFDPLFVERYIAPISEGEYPSARFTEVNSLACHFSLLGADYSNSDASSRIATVTPTNSKLCDELLETARATTPVDVRYRAHVSKIAYDDDDCTYTLSLSDGTTHLCDAVVLAECPTLGTLTIDSPRGDELRELLCYDAPRKRRGPATHLAVVVGAASAPFFRFVNERHIPDIVSVTGAEHFARVERVREVSDDASGIYLVYCSAEFESSGTFTEMFESGARIERFEERALDTYTAKPIESDKTLEDVLPPLVLGSKFIYAAASYAVARHPEMDAMAALNAASLFSTSVNWEGSGNGGEAEGDGDNVDEITQGDDIGGIEKTDFADDN